MPQSSTEVDIERVGGIVTVNGHVIFDRTGKFSYSTQAETIPSGFRPTVDNCAINSVNNATLYMLIDANGSVRMDGEIINTYGCVQGTWATDDPMPSA